MTASIQTPADLVNLALARIGYKLRVGSLYDGSAATKKVLDIYAQTRDAILRDNDWNFSERNISMTLLKQAPAGGYFPPTSWSSAYPPPPWFYEYAYPGDCLKVRSIKPQPLFILDFDPQPAVFSVANDTVANVPTKVILCNVASAVLTYSGQVTDLTQWEAECIELFAAELARRLSPALAGMEAAKLEVADAANAKAVAESNQG